MSLALYDQALYDKIHELFDNVINADESSVFSEAYDIDVDTQEKRKTPSIALPLISFWRTGNPPNLEGDGNYPSILKGRNYARFNCSDPQPYRTFPVLISYQISIWSDVRREVDEIFREFCMLFFVDEPYLTIRVANELYEDNDGDKRKLLIDEQFSLILIDSSTEIDTTSFPDRGRIYRQDIMIEVQNAKMFYLGHKKQMITNVIPKIEV